MLVTLGGCATITRTTLRPLGLVSAPGYAYKVSVSGVSGELESRVRDASALFTKKSAPPASLQGLKHRTLADRDVFLRVLKSRGYYDAAVTWNIDSTASPALVTMGIDPGPRYRIGHFDIEGLPAGASEVVSPAVLAEWGVNPDAPALAEAVILAESALVAGLAEAGYPHALVASRDARIDSGAHTMDVVVRVDAGPRTRFGEVLVDGNDKVDRSFVRARVTFHEDETFSPSKIEETRRALFASGVFSGVGITWGERKDVAADGKVPIRITVAEGKMHSVGAGVKYSSSEGFGGRAFWEDRNWSKVADRLRTEIEATELVATGGVSYRRPDWRMPGQSLLLDASANADHPAAYDRYALGISAGIERPFSNPLVGTAGLSLEQSSVNSVADGDGTRKFTLFGIPLGLRYDASDNLLDPSRGHRAQLGATPYISAIGDRVAMLSLHGSESIYVPLSSTKREIWATRVTLGSVIGPTRRQMPADKRLYAGGGDSVRGYQYQYLGPLVDVDSTAARDFKPKGGRSLLQVGTELRWKVTKTFGVVPFVEGAGVYEASYPDFREDFLWAAGLGLRYFTVAGPIRLDAGFPLNPRSSDSVFQIYISLGQAF